MSCVVYSCSLLHLIAPICPILYYTVLHCTERHGIVPYCTVLYSTLLHIFLLRWLSNRRNTLLQCVISLSAVIIDITDIATIFHRLSGTIEMAVVSHHLHLPKIIISHTQVLMFWFFSTSFSTPYHPLSTNSRSTLSPSQLMHYLFLCLNLFTLRGVCKTNGDCGSGTCSFSRCRCQEGFVGPTCLVRTYE